MPSASVALLSSLLAGRVRPKRLLAQESAPSFVSNLAVITGASAMTVSPPDIDQVLTGLLRTEGLKAEQVWAVATHRDEKLSPTDWLSTCAASGLPTIELCLGSLMALAQWSPFPATFTIVDPDAEEAFAGVGLAALLTSDPAMAARVRQLCLPSPGARDYILDIMPRGLAHDEPVLASQIEELIALGGAKPRLAERSRWSPSAAPAGNDSLLLAESRKKVDELQRTVDQWEARFEEAEVEAARDAEILSRARADLARQKSEFDRALASMQAEMEALAQKVRRAERERDLAVTAAAQHDEFGRGSARADLLKQRAEAEQALLAMQAEKQVLSRKLADLDRELGEARGEAVKREASQRAAATEQRQRAERLEGEAADLRERLARLETEQAAAERTRAELLARNEESERARAVLGAERDTLSRKLAEAESERDAARADAEKRGDALRSALDEETRRAAESEKDAAISSVREAARAQALAWESERVGLTARIARLEASAAETAKAQADLVGRLTADAERVSASLRAEAEAAARKLAEVEKERDLVRAEAAAREETQRAAAEEQRRRLDELEKEAAARNEREAQLERDALAAREAKLAGELEASRLEWTERLRRAEDAATVARNANIGLMTRKSELEQARVSLQAELEEQMRLAQGLKMEAAAVAAREAKKVEAAEASRAELEARIARMEAAEVIADKARNELLSRKRETDKALAAAQAERAALLKKLAVLEHERDQAQAAAGVRSPARKPPSPGSAAPGAAGVSSGATNTGGLSGLVSLWNTAVIKRPWRSKEKEDAPSILPGLESLGVEAIPGLEQPPSVPVPAPEPGVAAQKEADPPSPPETARDRITGGLSALVNLWNTAATMRPFKRKETEAKPADPLLDPVISLGATPEEAPTAGEPAATKGAAAAPRGDRPAPAVRPRPGPPRRPDPKPLPPPPPDEAEKLGGWLRDLAGRMRGKPK